MILRRYFYEALSYSLFLSVSTHGTAVYYCILYKVFLFAGVFIIRINTKGVFRPFCSIHISMNWLGGGGGCIKKSDFSIFGVKCFYINRYISVLHLYQFIRFEVTYTLYTKCTRLFSRITYFFSNFTKPEMNICFNEKNTPYNVPKILKIFFWQTCEKVKHFYYVFGLLNIVPFDLTIHQHMQNQQNAK
jgi:hypothetical protein